MDAQVLRDMFLPGLPVVEKILRPVIVYAFLIVGFRLAGKRELAQLNHFDLVVLLTISNTVQNAIIGDESSVTGGVVGAATLLFANYLVVRFVYKHEALERIIEGEPTVLIENDTIREDSLERELITRTEIELAARRQGLESLENVERAVLEPSGAISFIAKKPGPDAVRHAELTARLDRIASELAALRAARAAPQS